MERKCGHNNYYVFYTFLSFFLLRYDHDGNQEVEKILVKEVRESFGTRKWNKAEIKGWYNCSHFHVHFYSELPKI